MRGLPTRCQRGNRVPWLAAWGPAVLVACQHPSTGDETAIAPRTQRSPSLARPSAAAPLAPPATVDPCADRVGVLLDETPSTLDLNCERGVYSCSGALEVVFRNCSTQAVVLQQVQISDSFEGVMIFEPADGQIEAGAAWSYGAQVREGVFEVTATYRTTAAEEEQLARAGVEIHNPGRDAALVACENCRGEWGRSMAGDVGCRCRMPDEGRLCEDGLDCLGTCVSTTSTQRGPVFRCSEFAASIGCHTYLPDGWSSESHPAPVRLPRRCRH